MYGSVGNALCLVEWALICVRENWLMSLTCVLEGRH